MAMRYYAPFPGGGGEPPWPPGPHTLRIGDAERDAAAADLSEHYAAGRLTLDELNERLDAVFCAKTFGQLAKVMADLPGSGKLSWRADSGRPAGPGARPGPGPHTAWKTGGFPYETAFGMDGGQWHAPDSAMANFQPKRPQETPTASDRAGRFAAVSLLLLAMLIWLFVALLFARHGLYQQNPYGYGPPGPFGHYVQHAQLVPSLQGLNATGP